MDEKILETFETSDIEGNYDYQIKKTNITKERKLFTFIPIWVGSKFSWLKTSTILERKYYTRRKEFDSGWKYQFYWAKWKEEWRIEEILK